METIKVTVKSVKLFRSEDENGTSYDVQLTINEPIDGYKKDENDNYVAEKVNSISVSRPQFTANVCNVNDNLALYRSGREQGFDQKSLGVLFTKSTMDIVRTHHTKDEELLDDNGNPVKNKKGEVVTYQRDCYTTRIIGVTLSTKAQELLDNWMNNAL